MPTAVNDVLPLTHSQRVMWLQWKYAPHDPAYNNPLLFTLDGELDVARLKRAFVAVADAHPAIRMRFVEQAGEPLQYADRLAHDPLAFVDLSDLEPSARQQRIDAALDACLLAPFDLHGEPVFRFLLIRTGPHGYLLALNIHHICVDGASALMLLNDISSAYNDHAAYAAAPETRASQGFSDTLDRERQRWADGAHRETEAAWRACLAGRTCAVDFGKLVFDGERPVGAGARQYRWSLPGTLHAGLKSMTRKTRTTPFVVLMSAFGVLLHRYLQQDALAIAYPVDTRPAGFERIFGSFINYVPAFVDVTPELTVDALFERVRQQRRQTKSIVDFPQLDLMRLVRQNQADPASPCLNVALIPARFALDSLRLNGVEVEQTPRFVGSAKQDLALLYDGDDTLDLILEYRAGLLSESMAQQLARDFSDLVERMVDRQDVRIGDLELGGQRAFAGRHAVLADPAPQLSAGALIEAALRVQPGRQAVGEPGRTIANRALLDAANRVAWKLAAANVKAGDRVGVAIDRSGALLAALLGIWKAGATYVPLPANLPAARRAHIAHDAGLAVCLHQDAPAAAAPRDLVLTDDLFDEADAGAFPAVAVDPDSPAYLIYTSGSTGTPKGVEVTHRNLAGFLLAMRRALPMGRDDRLLATTTIGFDISLLELLLPLMVGAAVVPCPEHVRLDAQALEAMIACERISWLQGTPSFFNVLRAGGWRGARRLNVLCGGESIDASTHGFLRDTCAAVWQVYGPTEATIWSMIAAPDAAPAAGLGAPLGNTTIHLLDAHGQTVPRFSKGEICIGGHGVARGYRNRRALTDERFVEIPGAGRVYRTGDFGFRDAHERLRFLGREDGQVKIRGFRVELGEIEQQIEALGQVRKAVVQVRASPAEEPTLLAWVEPVPDGARDAAALRDALSLALPAYMVPSHIEWVDAWPLNANGKIDRAALPECAQPAAAAREARPLDPLAPALQAIYAEVLGVAAIDPDATLMSLGGHSLSAVRILARIRQTLDLEVGLEAFMTHSSVTALVDHLRASGLAPDGADAAERSSSRPAHGGAPAPAARPDVLAPSAAERGLYFLDSVAAVRETYNIPVGLHFPAGVDIDILERALRHVLDGHASLRAAFEPTAAGLVKRIHPTPAGALVERHGATDRAALQPLLNRLLREPFDLHCSPLLRVHYFPLLDGGAAVFYLFHHIVVDGIGCGNFLREMAHAYEAMLAGAAPSRPVEPAADAGGQPADAAARVDELIGRFGLVDRVLNLPYRAPFPEVRTLAGDSFPLMIPAALRAELDDYSRTAGVPLATLFLSAFALALHHFSRDRVVNIGLATMNRTPETLQAIGLYTNTVVLPVDIDPAHRLGEFVDRVTGALFSIYGYADVPFEAVASRLVEYATLGRTPVFQAFFNFIDRSMYAFSMADLPVSEIPLRPTGAKFELSLEVNDFRTHTQVFIEYSADVFDAALIADIAAEFNRILFECVRSPGETVERLALTTHP
ncbi:amino acid adenylation domain-containing protein [Burkholderia sp. 4701]|nr:amino acid adenylation domain-containing protein [Burkholderia sp. 4701]MXN86426.1 amino acid adenylation domain-containing protein [Burkholderia sp. 4812]